LHEIYPGLKQELFAVQASYQHQVTSSLVHEILPKALSPILHQYRGHNHIAGNTASPEIQQMLLTRSQNVAEIELARQHDALVPAPIYSPMRQQQLGVKSIPKPLDIFLTDTHGDPHETHGNHIRATMLCDDENIPGAKESCQQRVARGELLRCLCMRYIILYVLCVCLVPVFCVIGTSDMYN